MNTKNLLEALRMAPTAHRARDLISIARKSQVTDKPSKVSSSELPKVWEEYVQGLNEADVCPLMLIGNRVVRTTGNM